MSTTLIDGLTAASSSDRFNINSTQEGATLFSTGLASGESADVQFSQDGGATFADLKLNGSVVALTSDDNTVTVCGVGQYRINKGTTAGAVTVTVHSSVNV